MKRLSYRIALYISRELFAASGSLVRRSCRLEADSRFWAGEAALIAWPDLAPGDLVIDAFGDEWTLKHWRPSERRGELLAVLVSASNGHEKEVEPAQVRIGKHRAIVRQAEALRTVRGAA